MDIDGRNFYPLIGGGEKLPSRPAYLECTYTQHRPAKDQWLIGARTDRHKLIFSPFNRQIKPELYDLKRDPAEKENIALRFPNLVEKYRDFALNYFSRPQEKKELTGREKEAMVKTLRGLGYLD